MVRSLVWGAIAACAVFGCSNETEQASRLDESRSAWRTQAAAHDATYSYEVAVQTFFGTFGPDHTVLQFEAGVATYRAFLLGTPPALLWEERGAMLGTTAGGAPLATVDALYDRCAREVLIQSPDLNRITLEFDARDLLTQCSYFRDGCNDGCEMGVWLSNLQFGKTY